MDIETSCTMIKWYRVTKGIHEGTAAAAGAAAQSYSFCSEGKRKHG